MIKLTEILKELSLSKGDASGNTSDQLLKSVVDIFIPSKMRKYFKYSDNGSELQDISVEEFIKDISKFIVAEQGDDKLIFKKEYDGPSVALINTKAPTLDLAVIGRMDLSKYGTNKNLPPTYTVDWSIVSYEYQKSDFGKIIYYLTFNYLSDLGFSMGSDQSLYQGSFRMWTKFMPKIAPHFGIILSDLIFPISKEDLEKVTQSTAADIDGFIAFKKYPPLTQKIYKATEGLSYINGEYGYADFKSMTYKLSSKNKEFDIYQLVKERKSLYDLIDRIEQLTDGEIISTGKKEKLKCVVFSFTDTMLAVKQQGNKLTITSI
jgi:hypothetical protein